MKSIELEVNYPGKYFPFINTALVWIEYETTADGNEITGIYSSEHMTQSMGEYVEEQAKKQFYNGSY